ncbi:hypothetical protein D3C76_28290 [compost metagenome]
MKAVIRIKLNPCIDTMQSVIQQQWVRGSGADKWEAHLTMTSTEGHVSSYAFYSEMKADALKQAYFCLAKHRIHLWFNDFYEEEFAKYEDIFEQVKGAQDRWLDSMEKVQAGVRSKEQHLKLWAARMEHYRVKDKVLPPPTNQEHVFVSEPVKKWKWYHWFWNPKD